MVKSSCGQKSTFYRIKETVTFFQLLDQKTGEFNFSKVGHLEIEENCSSCKKVYLSSETPFFFFILYLFVCFSTGRKIPRIIFKAMKRLIPGQ